MVLLPGIIDRLAVWFKTVSVPVLFMGTEAPKISLQYWGKQDQTLNIFTFFFGIMSEFASYTFYMLYGAMHNSTSLGMDKKQCFSLKTNAQNEQDYFLLEFLTGKNDNKHVKFKVTMHFPNDGLVTPNCNNSFMCVVGLIIALTLSLLSCLYAHYI